MEDQIGEVESIETKIPSVKGKSHHPKYLTITVMRSVGKIRSFKISRRLVFWSTIFFVTYIITSTYFINDWVDKRRIKNDHSEKIKRLETDLLKSKKERLKSKQRLALLEDYIRNIEERREQESQPSKSKDLKEIGKNTNPPLEWTHPKEKLQNGVPVNYRRGLPFLIQRFKPYHFQFDSDSNNKLPTTIKVLVYNQSGELILEKEFEVSNVS